MIEDYIVLAQILPRMANSERLLIVDEEGQELYKGFVANFVHSSVDKLQPVKEIRITTSIFKKGNPREKIPQPEKVAVQLDNVTDFCFSDLEIVIYQKITLKTNKKNRFSERFS